jgi:hypothetical protein
MELGAGAGRLGCDRVGAGGQPVDAADVDRELFAPRADDLVVQGPVALVGGQVAQHQVLGGERGQRADHHDRAVGLAGPVLGPRQALRDVRLVVGEPAPGDQPRSRVQLEVELAQFGLERRVGEVGQDLGVAHRRLGVLIHQVELDLEPGHPGLGVERGGVEHPGQHVQAAANLPSISGAVLRGELRHRQVLAHSRLQHHTVSGRTRWVHLSIYAYPSPPRAREWPRRRPQAGTAPRAPIGRIRPGGWPRPRSRS